MSEIMCEYCEIFSPKLKPIEECKFDVLSSIFTFCIENKQQKFKNIEPQLEELVGEYIKTNDLEVRGYIGFCYECSRFTRNANPEEKE